MPKETTTPKLYPEIWQYAAQQTVSFIKDEVVAQWRADWDIWKKAQLQRKKERQQRVQRASLRLKKQAERQQDQVGEHLKKVVMEITPWVLDAQGNYSRQLYRKG